MCILYFVIANLSTPWREIVALKRTFFRTFWNMHITNRSMIGRTIDTLRLEAVLRYAYIHCYSTFHYTPLEPL